MVCQHYFASQMSTTVSRFYSLFALTTLSNTLTPLSQSHRMIYKILSITRKVFTPLKNNKLKLSVISRFTSMVYDKKRFFSTLRYSCFSPLLNILEIGGVYCFVKLHPLRQTELFQCRCKVYVKSHRCRIVV